MTHRMDGHRAENRCTQERRQRNVEEKGAGILCSTSCESARHLRISFFYRPARRSSRAFLADHWLYPARTTSAMNKLFFLTGRGGCEEFLIGPSFYPECCNFTCRVMKRTCQISFDKTLLNVSSSAKQSARLQLSPHTSRQRYILVTTPPGQPRLHSEE